jgi:hypothetical protein
MKIASFDIGIENMALCVLTIDESSTTIDKWDVFSLLEEKQEKNKCGCIIQYKTKKCQTRPEKKCEKTAEYEKNGIFYCKKHAIDNTEFLMPFKESSPTFLKKQNIEELLKNQKKYFPKSTFEKCSKKELLDKNLRLFQEKCYNKIDYKKEKNANETDLITIGQNLNTILDKTGELNDVNVVLIENQISPIATRMKTVQGMLTQYFIIKYPLAKIEYISSSNKLKGFSNKADSPSSNTDENIVIEPIKNDKTQYRKNKKNGIEYCLQLLEINTCFSKWASDFKQLTTKQDDLSDCLLQGFWFLRNRKLISCAENLKINNIILS